ncbi:DUF4450 domain-containing protein [Wenyingzhuangia sp. IMCC45467]
MKKYLLLLLSASIFTSCHTETKENINVQKTWHHQTRELRYHPEGNEFVIVNGEKRFNRALYGTNTGFRVEAGDLPEFGLYMTRYGGTLKLGLATNENSIWLIDAKNIKMTYGAGAIKYSITDPILKDGILDLELLALQEADGMILKVNSHNIPEDVKLVWTFGGATGKRFSREGDLGADPESNFYLKAENCVDNDIYLNDGTFHLYYNKGRELPKNAKPNNDEIHNSKLITKKRIAGIVPTNSAIKIGDAHHLETPNELLNSKESDAPVVVGSLNFKNSDESYFMLYNPDTENSATHKSMPSLFDKTDKIRKKIADRFWMNTPDKYLNAAGAQLATAADAVWDDESYFMHGAVAWRMPLPGWRGAYAADWLGNHNRAKSHFRGYFTAQYTDPKSGPVVADPKTHLARNKEEKGTSIFTSGYISRNPNKQSKPHHYDMNLVFINQLLWHFKWTGDTDFLKESWPVIERHLEWEKRNFDPDNDGLYNAYAAIWASDALQYSGGAVTHASAYNYNANKQAAELAKLINVNPAPYQEEADKILKAINKRLWLENKGIYAEYQDLLGKKLVHPTPALWTIYHAIDEGISNPFQAYQATKYVDNHIPHIPVYTNDKTQENLYTLSTSNWMPYTWSINNVAMAEVLHTALAYWKSGRNNKAFKLMKGTMYDYMYMGSSPGNFGQLSHFDAFRGELYRDFADPVGVASRAFVEGLFGIKPDIINKKIEITPGWPLDWEFAAMKTQDIDIDYKQNKNTDVYKINTNFNTDIYLELVLNVKTENIDNVSVNGQKVEWKNKENTVGQPQIIIKTPIDSTFDIQITWSGADFNLPKNNYTLTPDDIIKIPFNKAKIINLFNPQDVFSSIETHTNDIQLKLKTPVGNKTLFVQLKQGEYQWWQPIQLNIISPIEIIEKEKGTENNFQIAIKNNTHKLLNGTVEINQYQEKISIDNDGVSKNINISNNNLLPGTNLINIKTKDIQYQKSYLNWNVKSNTNTIFETINLKNYYNDRVVNIFKEQYFAPRSPYPTLSIPVQGIGDWCSYKETEEINDEGIIAKAGKNNQIVSPQGIPFNILGEPTDNIIFTSQWDNYPESVNIPLQGNAKHVYLLMAGSAHHMQTRMVNGIVTVNYTDGSSDKLKLISPENWWPIEQDYYQDDFAFDTGKPQPPRLYLKTGEWHMDSYEVLKKNGTNKIDGGAAQLLDLPLNEHKQLKSLTLETYSNDLVIGLMGATLVK